MAVAFKMMLAACVLIALVAAIDETDATAYSGQTIGGYTQKPTRAPTRAPTKNPTAGATSPKMDLKPLCGSDDIGTAPSDSNKLKCRDPKYSWLEKCETNAALAKICGTCPPCKWATAPPPPRCAKPPTDEGCYYCIPKGTQCKKWPTTLQVTNVWMKVPSAKPENKLLDALSKESKEVCTKNRKAFVDGECHGTFMEGRSMRDGGHGVQFHFVKPTSITNTTSLTAWLNFVQLLNSDSDASTKQFTSEIGSPSKPIMPGSFCYDQMESMLSKNVKIIDFALPLYTYAYQLTFPDEKAVQYKNRPCYICASDPGPEVIKAPTWFFFAGDKEKKTQVTSMEIKFRIQKVVVVVPVSKGTTKDLTIEDNSIKVGSVDKKLCSILSVTLKCQDPKKKQPNSNAFCLALAAKSINPHSYLKFEDCDKTVQEKALEIMKPLCGFR